MSHRRQIPPIGRRSAPLSRRGRAAAGAAAVGALLLVAALIGNAGDDPTTRSTGGSSDKAASSSGQLDSAGGGAAVMPSTTAGAGSDVAADEAAGAAAEQDGAGGATGMVAGPSAEARIVRTGSLQVEVRKGAFTDAVDRLRTLATGVGGFVSASETTALGDDPRGTVTLRVPVKEFDRVLDGITRIGTVESVTTGSQDVTGEYTDVRSRIKALEAEREQINLVLGRAETIPDILAVRDRLTAVQAELEQYQGRQQVLDDQTSLSTITVSLHEKGSTTPDDTRPVERSGWSKLWHDSVDRFTDGGRAIFLGLATMAPWLLLALVLWFPVRALWRRGAPAAPDAPGGPPAG